MKIKFVNNRGYWASSLHLDIFIDSSRFLAYQLLISIPERNITTV